MMHRFTDIGFAAESVLQVEHLV